jgi:hypothetical protein
MAKQPNACPAGCSGGNPERQYRVDAVSLEEAGLGDGWTRPAMRCGYCGEIYSTELGGIRTRRGRFGGNTLMTAENWTPHRC